MWTLVQIIVNYFSMRDFNKSVKRFEGRKLNVKKGTRYLFVLLFVLLVNIGNATVYYVSASGDDANTGTSESQPWKTLVKVSSTSFSPGDQILFKRGDEWSGTITVTSSGSAGSPIVYGAYGSGEKPKIYGSEEITGWTQYSGNIYKATFSVEVEQLFIEDERMLLARTPNSGYHIISSSSSSTTFVSNDLDSSIDYAGATWAGRTVAWSFFQNKVKSSSSSSITLESAADYGLTVDNGFILMDKLEFLDSNGEWYYDANSKTLYFWAPSGTSPDNYNVRASVYNNGVDISNVDYVRIENLQIIQSAEYGIYINNSDYISIDNSDIISPDLIGIYMPSNSPNPVLTNNYIYEANGAAIKCYGTSAVINDNIIENTGLLENINKNVLYNHGSAIFSRNNNPTISYNRITNSGYLGIYWKGQNADISYNYINGACLVLDDGGGIYTYNGYDYTQPASAGSVVANNIVLNVIGNDDGYKKKDFLAGYGIYMDNNTHDVTIKNNTVSGCPGALYLHDNGRITVDGNVLMNSILHILNSGQVEENTLTNNIVYCTEREGAYATWWTDTYQRIVYQPGAVAKFDYNTYVSHYNKDGVFVNKADFAEWQSATKQDANSTCDFTPLNEGEVEELFYNDTKQTKTISLGNKIYRDIYGNNVSGSITLKSFTSKILIKTTATNDNNQSPVIQGQSINVEGDIQENDFIGQVVASDPDADQALAYEIAGGNEEGLFYIDATSGVIYAAKRIYEAVDKTVQLVVTVTDNATEPLSASATITINITGVEDSTASGGQDIPPSIISFTIPTTSASLIVPITSFSVDGNATEYLLNTTSVDPTVDDSNWMASAPTSYVFSESGTHTLYAWVKDANANISTSSSATITITLDDAGVTSTYSEYNFEEASGPTVIDSKGSNDGTIFNEELRVAGIKGNGLQLTGAGYINLGQCFGENVTDGLTISAWIKPTSYAGDYQGIVMHGGPIDDSFALYIEPDSKTVAFKTTSTTSAWTAVNNLDLLWDGEWHHVAVTYNGAEKVIYLDNQVLTSVAATGTIESGAGLNLLIGAGRDYVSPTLRYIGYIDEVRIYNYGLTASEVAGLYVVAKLQPEAIHTTEEIEICQGESYLGWTESGTYEQKLTAASGADSIVTTYLTVNPILYTSEEVTINEGESYEGQTESGVYKRTLTAVTGCDSIVTTTLTVLQDIHTTEEIEICQGESYLGWTASGIYEQTLTAASGADSIVTTYLTVNPILYTSEEVTINEGESYEGLMESGVYERTLTAVTGCDSIVTTTLTVLQSIHTTEEIEICQGESYLGWTESGTYEQTLTAASGADSIVTTYLAVNPVYDIVENIVIQAGEDYNGWTASGEYIRNLTTVLGCDSTITTVLSVEEKSAHETVYSTEEISICEGDSYEGLTSAGEYRRVLQSITGGDSIVTTYLTVNPVYNIVENIVIQAGEDYNGWTTSGEYVRNLTTVFGCDSTVTTHLIVEEDTRHFVPVWDGENGQNHMTFVVTKALVDSINLGIGDEIAVFDNDICVGAVVLTSSINIDDENSYVFISASQATEDLNGFTDGNDVIFKIWDSKEQVEKVANHVIYHDDLPEWIISGKFEARGTSVVEISYVYEEPIFTQTIQLELGWNIFSAAVVPDDPNIEVISSFLVENKDLFKVQNEEGKTYEKIRSTWINNIGDMKQTEGYRIRVKSACNIEITGTQVSLPMDINLKAGSNLISFPYNGSVDAMQVIQPLIDAGALEKVQDQKGNSIEYWGPEIGWLNGIGNFNVGQGYQVQVNSDVVLTIGDLYEKSVYVDDNIETVYFQPEFHGNGLNHMNINLFGFDESHLSIGDEIAAYDGDICVGAITITASDLRNKAVSINASSTDIGENNGFTEDNNIELKFWDSETNEVKDFNLSVVNGELTYRMHSSVFIKFEDQLLDDENGSFSIDMYPNPATNNVNVRFSQIPESGAQLLLLDINGKQLQSRQVQSTLEKLDISSYPAGMYFIKTIVGDLTKTNKLIKN
ncbi:LamG-like jellyroll fold domain-containing protein [Draconibacterium orientale]|uniref:LamG-like jellyroll fold domain-containing protein n=1 Tax=Draconibacterium orientale TaxID=1168034 RepID=UPI002A0A954A|nr:LamG-like jellyroll fold domain-containing protein [Draconibacterium orientale]